jgi:putative membrane protein
MNEEDRKTSHIRNRRVHMANERTFLAWIRTSIGIMAFGFVVEKFALFVRQFYMVFGKEVKVPSAGYSSIFGATLIGFGATMGVLAFARYRKVEKQIDADTYQPSLLLDIMVTLTLLAIAVFLIIYLLHSA